MQIELTWQTLLTIAAVIGAFVAVVSYLRKLFGWFEKQEMQDKSIKDIQKEQYVLTNGILACLKGLVELGCDGAGVSISYSSSALILSSTDISA